MHQPATKHKRMLEPEVPLENVLAFVAAMQEFGGHRRNN